MVFLTWQHHVHWCCHIRPTDPWLSKPTMCTQSKHHGQCHNGLVLSISTNWLSRNAKMATTMRFFANLISDENITKWIVAMMMALMKQMVAMMMAARTTDKTINKKMPDNNVTGWWEGICNDAMRRNATQCDLLGHNNQWDAGWWDRATQQQNDVAQLK